MNRPEPVSGPYEPRTIAIEPERVAAFTEALGADPALGIPPTFAAYYLLGYAIPAVINDERIGIDFTRMLHGEQEFSWTRHPRLGEELTVTAQVSAEERKGPLRMITVEATATDVNQEVVCTSRSVLVER